MASDLPTLLRFFKALADESRLRLLSLVAQRERSVQELAMLLALKEPTASHHLAMLKSLGLVRVRQDGNTRWYRFEPGSLAGLARSVLGDEQIAALVGDVPPAAWDDHVLGAFVLPDGTLKTIPASRKKRRIVLAWMLRDFEAGRRYPEAEVNALIQRRHWDSATLRREMIGYHMLAREHGIYWRLDESEWRDESGQAA
ncbi:MAG TPA: metalloregulator ArsR/SmtB family transcription factor [Aliidongia sp.]|nr:metalloregulator ArsR/SmtB family transcription factor [Aliidongia sp.]